MMNINEPKDYGYISLKKSGKLIRSSFFLYAKIAGAHKSSPAKGKGKGCGCEGGVTHTNNLSRKITAIIVLFFSKCNREFGVVKCKIAVQWKSCLNRSHFKTLCTKYTK